MFGIGKICRLGVAPPRGFLPETVALIAAMTVKPTPARATLMDNLMRSLRAAGILQVMDLFYVLCAHDAQAARVNWAKPGTNTASEVNSPTFDVDSGYQGDGTSSYVNSGLAANAGVHALDGSMSFGIVSLSTHTSYADDAGGGGNGALLLKTCAIGNQEVRCNFTNTIVAAVSDGRGIAIGCYDGTTGYSYRDGTLLSSAAKSKTTLGATAVWFLHSNTYSTRKLAAGFYGGYLTASQVATLNTALKTYLNAVTPGLLP
jgi:hypothetical protein